MTTRGQADPTVGCSLVFDGCVISPVPTTISGADIHYRVSVFVMPLN
jgi:hypothetical protein